MAHADLHTHTHFSDGSDAPARVVERAVDRGLEVLAITDHDTLAGLSEASAEALARGIRFVHGVEISAGLDRREVHVVGLGIRLDNPALRKALDRLRANREKRAGRILEKLAALDIHIGLGDLQDDHPGGALGRMHIALRLREMGVTRRTQEGFDRFLNPGRPAFVPKATLPLREAVDRIHEAGGLAFIAHPGLSRGLQSQLPSLLEYPFDGIEAYHCSHTPGQTSEFIEIAEERGLLISGGSDCHGHIRGPAEMGKTRLPMHHACRILERLSMQRQET